MVNKTRPATGQLLEVFRELILPMASIERTIQLPHDLEHNENDAEHSYFLATLGCALGAEIDSDLDLGKVSQYALVHDLVEVYAGDTPVWAPSAELEAKAAKEKVALDKIEARFGAVFPWIARTIEAYERFDEPESCFVYALDKILPHAIILIADYHPLKPTWERYKRREVVAREKVARYPLLLNYFEDLCTEFAKNPHYFSSEVKR